MLFDEIEYDNDPGQIDDEKVSAMQLFVCHDRLITTLRPESNGRRPS